MLPLPSSVATSPSVPAEAFAAAATGGALSAGVGISGSEGPDGPQGTHCGITELASNGDADVCTEIDASGYRSCGASSQLNSTYLYNSVDALRDMVDAVRDAKPLGNHTQCPSYGTELPKWSGTHAIDDDEPYSPLSTTKGTISTNLSHTTPSTVNQSFAKHDD